jgi:hypothetical protein
MPVCQYCKVDKPDRAFRLWKKCVWDAPILMAVCIYCETQPKKKCMRCDMGLGWEDVYKGGKFVYFCKKCHDRDLQVKAAMARFILTRKLNNLIKKADKMPNLIGDLRGHLFQTIEGLKDGTISPDIAAQIVDVAKAVIDSARAENEFIALTGSGGSGFIPLQENNLIQLPQIGKKQLV